MWWVHTLSWVRHLINKILQDVHLLFNTIAWDWWWWAYLTELYKMNGLSWKNVLNPDPQIHSQEISSWWWTNGCVIKRKFTAINYTSFHLPTNVCTMYNMMKTIVENRKAKVTTTTYLMTLFWQNSKEKWAETHSSFH